MTINKTINRIIKVVLTIIIILILFYACGDTIRTKTIKVLGGYTAMDVKEKIDTVNIKYDSVYSKLKQYEIKIKNLPKKEDIKEYVYKEYTSTSTLKGKQAETSNNTIKDTNNDYVSKVLPNAYLYNTAYSDTLISGNIKTVLDANSCEIIEQTLQYEPKFPIFITKTVTVEKTKENTLYDKPKPKIGLGLLGGFNKSIGAFGVYQTPSNWQFQAGYIWNDVRVPTKDEVNNATFESTIKNGSLTFQIIKLF